MARIAHLNASAALLPALFSAALPLSAQAWDIRAEVPFAKGQSLPQTLILGTTQAVAGDLDTGHGAIFSVNHRIIRVGPVLKLEWGAEFAQLQASGDLQRGSATLGSSLKQTGVGLGINAQFWVPFTGVAGEMGLIQRFQHYKYEGDNASQSKDISRTWLRVGARWRLPFPVASPYIAASYQQPLSKDRPVHVNSVSDVASYLNTQGSGQEFERLWTFGVGLEF
ncbi:MAG TPA: hypothetical protein PKL14_03980 [Holophaga sp.]|nr:hypothetical protein [Holophaga sp.]